eukprot:GHVN01023622.1.p1 GENE.GHVN01023622.1~~GHVN01023622.1.p1  ORF type:complete len:125 (+),score=25.51 GHVN01023622.1:367-741(+)
MEDYNTATMPSKKYYNLAAWEAKQATKSSKSQDKSSSKGKTSDTNITFNDERDRKMEIDTIRDQRRQMALKEELTSFSADPEKVKAMKHQQELKTQMQILFKMGRVDEANKIQTRLEPDPIKYT